MFYIVPAENKEIQYGYDRQEIEWEARRQKANHKEKCIDESKPFYLYWNNKEEQNLHIREERSK